MIFGIRLDTQIICMQFVSIYNMSLYRAATGARRRTTNYAQETFNMDL